MALFFLKKKIPQEIKCGRSSDRSERERRRRGIHGHSIMNIKRYKMLIIRNNLHNYFTDFFLSLSGHIHVSHSSSLCRLFCRVEEKNVWIFWCVFNSTSPLPTGWLSMRRERRWEDERSTDNCYDLCWYVKSIIGIGEKKKSSTTRWRKKTKFYYPPNIYIDETFYLLSTHKFKRVLLRPGPCCVSPVMWCSALLLSAVWSSSFQLLLNNLK